MAPYGGKSRGYYCPLFKVYRGVTQGYPLSPTVCNVVMDSIIRKWVTVVSPAKSGKEGLGETVQELVAHFYAGDGLIASPQTERLHRSFVVLTYLFKRVILHTNVHNMVSMACRPCRTRGGFQRRSISDGLQGSGNCTGSGYGAGFSARSVAWSWRWGPSWYTARVSTEWYGGNRVIHPTPTSGRPRPIRSLSP